MTSPEPIPSVETKRRKPRWRGWLRDGLLVLAVIVAVQWWQSRDLVHGQAPPLVGLLVDGSAYQLDAGSGPTLVHFWATWCPVCRLEQDGIDDLADDYPVISIATTSGTPEELAAYLAEHALDMPVLMDESGELARAWGVSGVPATFLVDRAGRIAHAGVGYAPAIGWRLRMWWADRRAQ